MGSASGRWRSMRIASVLQAAQHEEAVERARAPAGGVLVEGELVAQRVGASTIRPPTTSRMPAEVLGRGMQHDVRAEVQRPLQVRRGEGVVDHGECPATAARRATALMSMTLSSGFDGVSIHTIRGARSPPKAAATASRSRRSSTSVSTPYRRQTLSARRHVPPYTSSLMSSRSPGSSRYRMFCVAARPDAYARPCVAPSSVAIAVSSAAEWGCPSGRSRTRREGRRRHPA